jgi:hypothetical protein
LLSSLFNNRRRQVVAGVLAVAILAGGGLTLAGGGDGDEPPPTTTTVPPTTTTIPPTTTTVPPPPIAPLTGRTGVPPKRRERPAVFVKIDNAPQARPQSGLVQADIVFEERVEGNTSRFAAVFHSTDAVEIGPVRSVRSTDMGFLPLFGRVLFASSGGSGPIIGQLHQNDVVDVGHNMGGSGFRRFGRRAPHNLYTSLRDLYLRTPERPAAPKQVFRYRSPGEKLPDTAKPAKGVALSFGAGEISRFVWDPPSKQFHRYHGSVHHLDAAGIPIAPVNVVVIEIQYEFSTTSGNSQPHGVSAGSGRALVYTAGHVIGGRWVRPTVGHRMVLLDSRGREIELTPGQTFVETPPPGGFRML